VQKKKIEFFHGKPFFDKKEAFPGGGRWHGKAVTDEVAMDPAPFPKTFNYYILL